MWRLWPLIVGLPLILLLAVAAIAFSGGEESAPRTPEGRPQGQELGTPALGSADAPVVLTEYSDYQ